MRPASTTTTAPSATTTASTTTLTPAGPQDSQASTSALELQATASFENLDLESHHDVMDTDPAMTRTEEDDILGQSGDEDADAAQPQAAAAGQSSSTDASDPNQRTSSS